MAMKKYKELSDLELDEIVGGHSLWYDLGWGMGTYDKSAGTNTDPVKWLP